MKVIFKDKSNDLIVVEATAIGVDTDENHILMKVIDTNISFICKDQDLVKNFKQIIKHELESAYIDFSNYIFMPDDKHL